VQYYDDSLESSGAIFTHKDEIERENCDSDKNQDPQGGVCRRHAGGDTLRCTCLSIGIGKEERLFTWTGPLWHWGVAGIILIVEDAIYALVGTLLSSIARLAINKRNGPKLKLVRVVFEEAPRAVRI
jgi:hypothetical protein